MYLFHVTKTHNLCFVANKRKKKNNNKKKKKKKRTPPPPPTTTTTTKKKKKNKKKTKKNMPMYIPALLYKSGVLWGIVFHGHAILNFLFGKTPVYTSSILDIEIILSVCMLFFSRQYMDSEKQRGKSGLRKTKL